MKMTYSATLRGTTPETQADVLRDWLALVGRDLNLAGSSNDHHGGGRVSLTVRADDAPLSDSRWEGWGRYVWACLDLSASRPGREGLSVEGRDWAAGL